jgi:hypothetical protein
MGESSVGSNGADVAAAAEGPKWIVKRSQSFAELISTERDGCGKLKPLPLDLLPLLKNINNTLKHADTEQVYKKTQQQQQQQAGQQQAQRRRITSMHAQAFVFMVYLLRHCGVSDDDIMQWAQSMHVDVHKSNWLILFLKRTAAGMPVQQRLLAPWWMVQPLRKMEGETIMPNWDNIHGSIDLNYLGKADKRVMTYILQLLLAKITPY